MIYTIIGAIILILVLILLAILLIPFHISFYLQKREADVRGKFKISWLKIRLIERDIPAEEVEKKKEKKKKERKFDFDQFFKVLKQFFEAFDYLKPIFRAFLRSITLEKFSLDLNFGFYSPVTTAMVSGYFWSVSSILNFIPPINLSMTPDFQKSKFDGSIDLSLKLRLFWIVAEVIRAFTKKPVRALFGSIRELNR